MHTAINETFVIVLFAISALLHGISGTGFSLITIGGLSTYYSLSQSVLFVLLPTAVMNAIAWLYGGGSVYHNFTFYLKKYWLLVLLSLIGSLFGAYLLLRINQHYLLLLLSAIIFWYVVSTFSGKNLRLSNNRKTLVLFGILGGIAGGATNAMAPILMMYLLSASDDKHTIIKVGNLCFLVGKIAQAIVLHQALINLPQAMWRMMLVTIAISVAFVLLGIYLGRFLPKKQFKLLILWILLGLAVKLGYSGMLGFV